jgi:large subunit ribosomal protein L6
MSRVGKKMIILPEKVQVEFDTKSLIITVKGPLGELKRELNSFVKLDIKNGEVVVSVTDETVKYQKAIWGTSRAVIQNMITGVSTGFNRTLELNGVGYKMELAPTVLTLYIGFSHTVPVDVPPQIKLTLNKNILTGTSNDNELIGNFFSTIHNMKPCDPYKQKGFKFPGRFYKKKVVKKTK